MPLLQSKLLAYGVLSTGLALAVLTNAWNGRRNFYASAVQVGSSNGSILVLANFGLFVALSVGLLVKRVFFGPLRPIEIEHLYDRSWYFFTETMLALAMFRDDLDAHLVALFAGLLFLKCFHWISSDRVEYMDQFPPPGPPLKFHLRLVSAIASLALLDVAAGVYCYRLVMEGDERGGVSGSAVFFGTEFAILTCTALSIHAKYLINLVDIVKAGGRDDAPPWEGKSMWTFYVDLVYYAVKLVIYTAFFYTIFILSGVFPINHIVPLYLTFRAFSTKCLDLVKYRRATRNMDTRYPDATQAEIDGLGGGSCVICREDMVAREPGTAGEARAVNDTPKKLGCGHVFHLHCLKSWLERQQSCPTCRRTVFDTQPTTIPAPQPGHVPIPATVPQATPTVLAEAAATPEAASRPQPTLQPVGIWRSESTASPFAVSPITHFRRRISELVAPLPPHSESEGPAIHVAPPTAEQASAFRTLPWEALTMAQRQRAIRTQPTNLSVNANEVGAGLRPPGSRNVSWDPSNGTESPWASHTPLTSQAPEVFSQIHATRVRTRSQARQDGTSREGSTSSVGGPEEGSSPAQMAAMAALRRANQQRSAGRRAEVKVASPPLEKVQFPFPEGTVYDFAPFDEPVPAAETPKPVQRSQSSKTARTYLVPLFEDPFRQSRPDFEHDNSASDLAPPSPRSAMAAIRWGVDQLQRSLRTGGEAQCREEVEALSELERDMTGVLAELKPAEETEPSR